MNAEKPQYNLGVVGGGWVARTVWLPRLLATQRFRLASIDDTDPRAVAAVVEAFPASAIQLGAPIDVALVATPNSFHAAQAERLLEAGVDVIVDKPVCLSLAELDRLERAAAKTGARLDVTNAASHRADVTRLREEVRQGRAGALDLVELSWVRGAGVPRAPWAMRKELAGGGVSVDLGWHLLEVGLELLGWPDTLDALAIGTAVGVGVNRAADWHDTLQRGETVGSDVESSVTAVMRTTRGGLTLRAAWASHEDIDRTRIVAHGALATLALETTFGFSPHRVKQPTLVAKTSGKYQDLSIPDTAIGCEYDACVGQMLEWLDSGRPTRWNEMRAIVTALEAMTTSLNS